MHPHLKVLLEELKLIRDNSNGGLKKNSDVDLTHTQVISSIRAFVRAFVTPNYEMGCYEKIDDSLFGGWQELEKDKVLYYLDLIRTRGIPHCDRSRAAKKCVDVIEAKILLEEESQKSNDDEWATIPF